MAKKAESRLQLRIHRGLRKQVGGKWFKVHGGPFQEAGHADLNGTVDGHYFGFEIKLPLEGTPSEIQLENHSSFRDEGAIVCIVETAEQAVAIVKAYQQRNSRVVLKGAELYQWIWRVLDGAFGEDLGYATSPRRKTPLWVKRQMRANGIKLLKGEVRLCVP